MENHFHPSLSLARIESGLSLVFCVLLGALVLVQVLRSGPINAQRIQGAVALSLLLARIWTFAYVVVALGDSHAFSFPAEGLHPQVLMLGSYISAS